MIICLTTILGGGLCFFFLIRSLIRRYASGGDGCLGGGSRGPKDGDAVNWFGDGGGADGGGGGGD